MLFSPTELSECFREWDDLEKDYQHIQVGLVIASPALVNNKPWQTDKRTDRVAWDPPSADEDYYEK